MCLKSLICNTVFIRCEQKAIIMPDTVTDHETKLECGNDKFACRSGQCIHNEWLCDGQEVNIFLSYFYKRLSCCLYTINSAEELR